MFSGSLDHIVCLHLPWFFWSSFFIQLLTILPVDVQVSLHQNWPNFSKTVVFLFIPYSTASSTNIIVCITFYLKVFYTNMLRDNLPLYMHFFFFFSRALNSWRRNKQAGKRNLDGEVSRLCLVGFLWLGSVPSLPHPCQQKLTHICMLFSFSMGMTCNHNLEIRETVV